MIKPNDRVRIRPADPQIYEMLDIAFDRPLVGSAIAAFRASSPFAYDNRERWCVRLDDDFYGLFYETEIEVILNE